MPDPTYEILPLKRMMSSIIRWCWKDGDKDTRISKKKVLIIYTGPFGPLNRAFSAWKLYKKRAFQCMFFNQLPCWTVVLHASHGKQYDDIIYNSPYISSWYRLFSLDSHCFKVDLIQLMFQKADCIQWRLKNQCWGGQSSNLIQFLLKFFLVISIDKVSVQ